MTRGVGVGSATSARDAMRGACGATPGCRAGGTVEGMRLRTRFTEAFGLTTPIAQAGMAFVGMTPELPVAVSDAGALGSLGVGLMPAPALAQTIAAIQAKTDRPFNVNFITVFTEQAQIDAVCEAGVAVVSFHWGHPEREWIDQLHAAGVRVFEQLSSVDAAKRAVDDGIDVVVAQGLLEPVFEQGSSTIYRVNPNATVDIRG